MAINFRPNKIKVESLVQIVGEDKAVLLSIIENIIKGNEEVVEKLVLNVNEKNWNSIRGNAHFLKSNFRYVGCDEITEILRSIEHAAPDEHLRRQIAELMSKFNMLYPEVMQDLLAFKNYLLA